MTEFKHTDWVSRNDSKPVHTSIKIFILLIYYSFLATYKQLKELPRSTVEKNFFQKERKTIRKARNKSFRQLVDSGDAYTRYIM